MIVPIAADRPEYETHLPQSFTPDIDGTLLCIKSITGLNLDSFNNIYFSILQKHVKRFDIDKLLQIQFARLGLSNAHVTILDEPTSSQVDTVCQTVNIEHINGSIYVKDADCSFRSEVEPSNSIAIYPLEQLKLVNPQHKSYVTIDDMRFVTNIIEKKIISHYFCAGGYGFENVEDLLQYHARLKSYPGLYMSHIIYAMLLDKKIFRPIDVHDYNDFEQK